MQMRTMKRVTKSNTSLLQADFGFADAGIRIEGASKTARTFFFALENLSPVTVFVDQ
ncbi:hypothetical protein Mal48_02840 [Thalassoglobus polymorphus]|uniref:Uncharacterized protein n=1 Tax=Thalassoglobus polymorphus TaxID=2527994 RepID=A0A517QHD9_9PLAN|nr:hypothetical protein Mal48_02840 [Thalassoglobus polymorphus]